LRGNRLRDGFVRALAASPHVAGLTSLNLSDNSIGDEGARALASSPHLSRLTYLDVHDNGITAEVRALLVKRFRNVEFEGW
jgi:hypothetical protein